KILFKIKYFDDFKEKLWLFARRSKRLLISFKINNYGFKGMHHGKSSVIKINIVKKGVFK
ncbi:hypothetical protein, partial [Psychrilyobacter sp. S5]|uniref:hypothetical protein n=1 Tax=Psychrilyobacter sp. S5 TaxID=2283384 RepID=UPI0021760C8B